MEETQEFGEENEVVQHKTRSQKKTLCPKCLKKVAHSTFRRHFMNCGRHICEQCEKKFSYAFELRGHLKTHEDSNVYHCNYCNKTLCNSFSFDRHLKSRFHLSNKDYALRKIEKTLIITLKEVKCLPDKTAKLLNGANPKQTPIISIQEVSLPEENPLILSVEEDNFHSEEENFHSEEEVRPGEQFHKFVEEETSIDERNNRSAEEKNCSRKRWHISFEEEDTFPHEHSHRYIKEDKFFNEQAHRSVEEEGFSHERLHRSIEEENFLSERMHISLEEEVFPGERFHRFVESETFIDERNNGSAEETNFSRKRLHISFEEEESFKKYIEEEKFYTEQSQISSEVANSPQEETHIIYVEHENSPLEQPLIISIKDDNFETNTTECILKDNTNNMQEEENDPETIKWHDDNIASEFEIITIERIEKPTRLL